MFENKHRRKPKREGYMSNVRVLVGTRKGAFILTSDGKREHWDVSGPYFAGWEIYHLKGSPIDPNRLYASQSSGWFGQVIQRSSDGGKTWETPGGEQMPKPDGPPAGQSNKFVYETSPPLASPSLPTSGTTAHSIPGSSSASGIWNRRLAIRTMSMRELKTPHCSAPQMALTAGTKLQDSAATAQGRCGSPAPAACVCTRLFWIRRTRSGCSSRFRQRGRPHGRRRRDVATDQPWPALPIHSRSQC